MEILVEQFRFCVSSGSEKQKVSRCPSHTRTLALACFPSSKIPPENFSLLKLLSDSLATFSAICFTVHPSWFFSMFSCTVCTCYHRPIMFSLHYYTCIISAWQMVLHFIVCDVTKMLEFQHLLFLVSLLTMYYLAYKMYLFDQKRRRKHG